MTNRSEMLAERVAQAHQDLLDLCLELDDEAWQTRLPGDGRTVATVVHHVATMLELEKNFIEQLASGEPIQGLTRAKLDGSNAQHAEQHPNPTRKEALDLMRRNSGKVLSTIRGLSDAELDRASPVSLHWNAPLTTQYFIEEHPLNHSYEHVAAIRSAIGTTKSP